MELTYKYFEQDVDSIIKNPPKELSSAESLKKIAQSDGLARIYVVKKYLDNGRVDLLLKEYLPYNWGVSFNYKDPDDDLSKVVGLISKALLKTGDIVSFQKLWHKIIKTQLKDCKVYAKYLRSKDVVYPPDKTPSEAREEVSSTLDRTITLLKGNLREYKVLCKEGRISEDLDNIDSAMEILNEGKVPVKIF